MEPRFDFSEAGEGDITNWDLVLISRVPGQIVSEQLSVWLGYEGAADYFDGQITRSVQMRLTRRLKKEGYL